MERKMTLHELDNLVRIGSLKKEAGAQKEFDGLVHSGRKRLDDARNDNNSMEGRFDLAYNAAHALCLAALRWHGYRSDKRFIVFQCIPHTLGLDASVTRVLAKCHDRRNVAEYQGQLDVDEQIIGDLVKCTEKVYAAVRALGPVPDESS